MRKINVKNFALIIAMVLLCFLTACGCGNDGTITYSNAENSLKETQLNSLINRTQTTLKNNGVSDEEVNTRINVIRTTFNATNTKEVLTTALENVNGINNIEEEVNNIYGLIVEDVKITAVNLLTKFYNLEDLKTHSKELVSKVVQETEIAIASATLIEANADSSKVITETSNLYQIIANHALNINTAKTQYSPIRWYSVKEDGFFSMIFNNFLVFPIGWLLQAISGLFGGYYIIGLLIVTIFASVFMSDFTHFGNALSD